MLVNRPTLGAKRTFRGFSMRLRFLALLAALVLVVAACSDDDSGGQATELRHTLEPGTSFSYVSEMEIDFDIDLDVPSELLEGSGFDFDVGDRIVIDLAVGFDVDVDVAEGPEADQRNVTVTQAPTSLTGSAEFGGETAEFDLAYDGTELSGTITTNGEVEEVSGSEDLFGDLGLGGDTGNSIVTAYVLTEQGEVVSFSFGGEMLGEQDLGALGAMGDLVSTNLAAPVFGPAFPEDAVRVGSDWSDSTTLGEGALTFERSESHEVAAAEQRAGRDTLRIESTVTTSGIELDLGDLADLLGGLDTGGLEGDLEVDPEQMIQLFELLGVEFALAVDPGTATSTMWFDAAAGRVVEITSTAPLGVSFGLSGVPEMPGDIAASVAGEIRQSLTLSG